LGLAGAVPCFSRWPRVITAIARRVLGLLCAMYFDDASIQDLAIAKGAAQMALGALVKLLGTPFADPKRQIMAMEAAFLGVTHDLAQAVSGGVVRFRPKAELVEKVRGMICSAISCNRLTPGAASKLRGTLGFLVRETWGKVGRGGMAPLIQREFCDRAPWTLSLSLMASFEFHLAILAMDAQRTMQIGDAKRPIVIAASDGSYEDDVGGRVAALFCSSSRRWGWCGALTDLTLGDWSWNLNPIMKVEFYAVLMGFVQSLPELIGCDLLWFIDNTSALAAAVRGSSSDPDVASMTQLLYVLAYSADVRIFGEYVESDSNWADGASRDLLDDPWARANGFVLGIMREFRVPRGPLLERVECMAALGDVCGVSARLAPVVAALRRQRESAVGIVAVRRRPGVLIPTASPN
jgi:hypothetical protein